MGQILEHFGIHIGTRLDEHENNRIPIHHKCRNCGGACEPQTNICPNAKFTRTGTKEQPAIIRPVIPDNKVRWSSQFNYRPIEFTAEKIRTSTKEYVDKDPRQSANPKINILWNQDDKHCDRRSYHGQYRIVGEVPQNPCGRTGITGRGHLGHFGPNHAADPIVTRWKRDEDLKQVYNLETNKPILQFVSIRRKDTNELAIPGGMVDRKEKITETLQREFQEETLNFPNYNETAKYNLLATIKDTFEHGGSRIYTGYVDDPRNTDNAWMETTVYNFHDEYHEHLALLSVNAGSDARDASWNDMHSKLPLFASHGDFLKKVAQLHNAHW